MEKLADISLFENLSNGTADNGVFNASFVRERSWKPNEKRYGQSDSVGERRPYSSYDDLTDEQIVYLVKLLLQEEAKKKTRRDKLSVSRVLSDVYQIPKERIMEAIQAVRDQY